MVRTNLDDNRGERYCALALGIIFTILGVAGFMPDLVSLPPMAAVSLVNAPSHLYTLGFGYLFGLFPINLIHNLIHLIVGILGIVAFTDAIASRVYCRVFAYVYAGLAVLGTLSFTRMFFGLMPIFGNNVWFNGLTAAIAAYFGFFKPTVQTGNIAVPPPQS